MTAGHALAVSVDDFNYMDRSNEPTDQTAVHEKRLRAFMTALREDVTADRRFELLPSSCAPNCPTEGPALGNRLRAASQVGTQILIIGIVHKMSTLVQLVYTAAIDTTSQRVVSKKSFTFRGDAERFVSEEVGDRLLESRSQQQAVRGVPSLHAARRLLHWRIHWPGQSDGLCRAPVELRHDLFRSLLHRLVLPISGDRRSSWPRAARRRH